MAGALGIAARAAPGGVGGDGDGGEDDALLVARARADPRAFAPLYRRYVDRIYRYCYRRLGSREAAEDATAAVFAKALAALPKYRDGSFRGWLFAIAHNTIVSEFRTRAARPEGVLADAEALVDPAPLPEEAALAAEARASVLGLLPRLTDDQRRVLELRLAGLSGSEIAAVLGRSHGSVRVTQFRAIARLREWLAEAAGGDAAVASAEPNRSALPRLGTAGPAAKRAGPRTGAPDDLSASPSRGFEAPGPTSHNVAGDGDRNDRSGAEPRPTGATERSQPRTAGGRDG